METPVNQAVSHTETSDATAVWNACLDVIRERVNSQSFKTWFEPITPVQLQGRALTVQVPSQFFCDWLEEHYFPVLSGTIARVLGNNAKVEYSIRHDETPLENVAAPAPLPPPVETRVFPPQPESFTVRSPQAPPGARYSQRDGSFQSFLNPRYTFDNFIKGDSNQLARAAASAVSNNPGGTSFNPLVIYGGTGLGKTHLIQAIGNYALSHGKAKRVIYVSSEKFTVEFVDSIQSDRISDFSSFYRSMDVLIVDDIQFFAGKEKTQDNFFHTFNELHQIGKADRPVLRPATEGAARPRRPAALAVPVGTYCRYPAPGSRDAHCNSPRQKFR